MIAVISTIAIRTRQARLGVVGIDMDSFGTAGEPRYGKERQDKIS